MIEKSIDDYLEFLIHKYYNDMVLLKEGSNLYDDDFENLYALGYNLFTYGKYEHARDVFEKLTTEAPYTAHYWRALGAVNQQLQKYDEAIAAYDMAIANDERDVVSRVYRGESLILLGKEKALEEALEGFKKVSEIGDSDLDMAWIERSRLIFKIHNKFIE